MEEYIPTRELPDVAQGIINVAPFKFVPNTPDPFLPIGGSGGKKKDEKKSGGGKEDKGGGEKKAGGGAASGGDKGGNAAAGKEEEDESGYRLAKSEFVKGLRAADKQFYGKITSTISWA